ncbi:MAG: DUF1192 domain-containing protein [Pelagibacteraceae bacterium]|nr:DUF1192 domain-containing protein [Pelagibacteraceae bacterium]|tara:strand:+ start:7424 stop:7606 length:183 start_codon:yes stop_codon:yes gene_type:complete
MNEVLEIDEKTKSVNRLNLDDLSVEELKIYIENLKNEIHRVNEEIIKKNKVKSDAQKFFK